MFGNMSFEGIARGSSRRPWLTIALWVVLILGAGVLNVTLLPDALTTEFGFTNKPDSWRGDKLLEERLRGPKRSNEIVMVQSETLTVDDAEFQARVVGLYEQIIALGPEKVESGVNYYQIGLPSFVSADRKTTMMPRSGSGNLNRGISGIAA